MKGKIKILALIGMCLIAGYAGGHFAARKSPAMDMPIVVLDVQEFIDQAITGKNGQLKTNGVDEGVRRAREVARKFADAGYLVLERRAVLDSPGQYSVSPPRERKNGR